MSAGRPLGRPASARIVTKVPASTMSAAACAWSTPRATHQGVGWPSSDQVGMRSRFTGDLLQVPPQIAIPDSRSSHDEDPELGAVSRVAILGRARAEDWRVAVSHVGRPFGRVAADGWHSET